jgi:predicted DNA-binding transcriptional regulator YafY
MEKDSTILYSESEKQKLVNLIRRRNISQKLAIRAQIVLKRIEGSSVKQIVEQLGTTKPTVYLWIGRYSNKGVEGLLEKSLRSGRKPKITEAQEKAIVEATLHTKPDIGKQWSIRSMAQVQGVTRSIVHKIWQKYNLTPKTAKDKKIFPNKKQRNSHEKASDRKNRTVRLLKLQMVLWQHPHGLSIPELADKLSISNRTVYRDLEVLETDLNIPIWEEGRKRGVVEGYFLHPITFTASEAMKVLLAARLMQHYSYLNDPNIIMTFMKLNMIMPPIIRKQIQNTLDYINELPKNESQVNNINKIEEAWLSQHKVKIYYDAEHKGIPKEFIIEPYFIEPSLLNRSVYVIAYCHLNKTICTFNASYLIGDVSICPDTYRIPSDFNAIKYLKSAWDVHTDQEIQTIRLRFNSQESKRLVMTIWHPSQEIEIQNDGSAILTLKINNTPDFLGWLLAMGNKVEVLEPETLRDELIKSARSTLDIYSLG